MRFFMMALISTLTLMAQEGHCRSWASADQRLPLYNYQHVTDRLTPNLEFYFNVFLFVNTGEVANPNAVVPPQHQLIVRRKPGTKGPIFARDASGRILLSRDSQGKIRGLINGEVVYLVKPSLRSPDLFPVSTGKTQSSTSILTYSGIYGFNPDYNMPGTGVYSVYGTSTLRDGMNYSSFINIRYAAGNPSGLAFHGTTSGAESLLGVSRDSEGCIRQYPVNAQQIQDLLMENIGYAPELINQSTFTGPNSGSDGEEFMFARFNWNINVVKMVYVQKGLAVLFNDY